MTMVKMPVPGSYVIPFFFSEDWTKSLPLVGLQYHEVEIRIKCSTAYISSTGSNRPKVYGSYVSSLTQTNANSFANGNEHELLITQTQHQPMSASDTSIDLTYFNHPVKARTHCMCRRPALQSTRSRTRLCTLTVIHSFRKHDVRVLPRNVVPSRHCSVLTQHGRYGTNILHGHSVLP